MGREGPLPPVEMWLPRMFFGGADAVAGHSPFLRMLLRDTLLSAAACRKIEMAWGLFVFGSKRMVGVRFVACVPSENLAAVVRASSLVRFEIASMPEARNARTSRAVCAEGGRGAAVRERAEEKEQRGSSVNRYRVLCGRWQD